MLMKVLSNVIVLGLFCSSAYAGGGRFNDRERYQNGPKGNENSVPLNGRVFVEAPEYGGSGCPDGSVDFVLSPDNKELSILFSNFVAEADGREVRKVGLACNIRIPIQIPVGKQLAITRIDYRGFLDLPKRSKSFLHSTYQFIQRFRQGREPVDNSSEPITLSKVFEGPLSDEYNLTSGIRFTDQLSPCGGPASLNIRNDLMLETNKQPAFATIDSVDTQTSVVYYLSWKSCGNSGPGRGRPGG